MSGAGTAVRQASFLMTQRGAQVLAAALFAGLVPRLMGPDDFGRYALMTSVSMWFALLSGLGATSLLTRAVPELAGDRDALSKLVTQLISMRVIAGLGSAAMYIAVTLGWFGDLDVIALVCMAGAVLSRTAGNPSYALFLGLNRAARWGLGDLLRRWLTLVLVVAGFIVGDLRGACLGVLLANVIVLALGLWWARDYLQWRHTAIDMPFLRPYLRLSTSFAAGNLLLALAQRSGETLVRAATGDYAEVGRFGAAYAVYLTGADAIWHLTIAFAPMLVALHAAGTLDDVRAWIERIMRVTVIGGGVCLIAAAFLGDVAVRSLFGVEYAAVAASLVPLSFALIALAFGSGARVAALVVNRPGLSAQGAAVEVAVFWAAGVVMTRWWGSVGASTAACLAIAAYAVFLTWRVRSLALSYPLARPLAAGALAVAIASLAWWLPPAIARVPLFVAAAAVYLAGLWQLRVIDGRDLRAVLRRSPDAPPAMV